MGGGCLRGPCLSQGPSRGLSRDGLARRWPSTSRRCSPLGEGPVAGRREASGSHGEGAGSRWVHRSMLSSVGLEKQVCSSFSQNSSSSWIRGKSGTLSAGAGPCL